MTITYPKPVKAKWGKSPPLPIAPTAALRAQIALHDARNIVISTLSSIPMTVFFTVTIIPDNFVALGWMGLVVFAAFMFLPILALVFAKQVQPFSKPVEYQSGLIEKPWYNRLWMAAFLALFAAGFWVLLSSEQLGLTRTQGSSLFNTFAVLGCITSIWFGLHSVVRSITYAKLQIQEMTPINGGK
jgi:hypothetical protein